MCIGAIIVVPCFVPVQVITLVDIVDQRVIRGDVGVYSTVDTHRQRVWIPVVPRPEHALRLGDEHRGQHGHRTWFLDDIGPEVIQAESRVIVQIECCRDRTEHNLIHTRTTAVQ